VAGAAGAARRGGLRGGGSGSARAARRHGLRHLGRARAAQRQARDDTIRLLGEEGFEPFWEGLAPRLFSAGAGQEVVAQGRALAAEQGIPELVAAVFTLRDREDSTATLATIDVPALVVVGEEDALTPPTDAADLEDGIRRARLVRLPAAGHLTPLERPEEFNRALLSFLAEAALDG
jgi:pimeloyl-ACP methyl ester carboxylesterase